MTRTPSPAAGPLHADAPIARAPDAAPRLRLVVMRLARLLRQQTDPAVNLSVTLLSALSTVERLGPITLGDLAEAEAVQPPSVTPIVAKLEARGLVVRAVDSVDRRIARVVATPEGRRLLQRSRTNKTAFLARRLAALEPDERAKVMAALPVLERLVEGSR